MPVGWIRNKEQSGVMLESMELGRVNAIVFLGKTSMQLSRGLKKAGQHPKALQNEMPPAGSSRFDRQKWAGDSDARSPDCGVGGAIKACYGYLRLFAATLGKVVLKLSQWVFKAILPIDVLS